MSLLERVRHLSPSATASPPETAPADGTAPGTGPRRRSERAPRPWLLVAGHGVVAALAPLPVLALLPLLAAATGRAGAPAWETVLAAALPAWVLTHRGPVSVPGDHVTLVAPVLTLTALAVLLARLVAARALVRTAEGEGPWWRLPAAFVGGYTGTGLLVALATWAGPARADLLPVLPGAATVAGLGLLSALLRARRAGRWPRAQHTLAGVGRRVPAWARPALRPAAEGAALLLALGALVAVVALARSLPRIGAIGSALGLGTGGVVVLSALQLLLLPNVAAWAAVWLSGAALRVGPVTVGHAAVTPGVLPMVPALGAVPEAGAAPAWAPLAPVLTLLVGAAVGARVAVRLTASTPGRAAAGAGALAGGIAGVLVVLLAVVGSMGLTPGRLGYVGPDLAAAWWLPVQLAVGGAAAAVLLRPRVTSW